MKTIELNYFVVVALDNDGRPEHSGVNVATEELAQVLSDIKSRDMGWPHTYRGVSKIIEICESLEEV